MCSKHHNTYERGYYLYMYIFIHTYPYIYIYMVSLINACMQTCLQCKGSAAPLHPRSARNAGKIMEPQNCRGTSYAHNIFLYTYPTCNQLLSPQPWHGKST